MKQYFIQVQENNKRALVSLLIDHLKFDNDTALNLIKIGAVWNKNTNKRIKDPDHICKGDLLVIHKPGYKVPDYPFSENDIKYEDEDFIIIYKKGKYPTVPTPYSDVNSLDYALNSYLNKKEPGSRIFVINRLDIHTQGLVFFARNKKTEKILHKMFKERNVSKYYFAQTKVFDGVRKNYLIQDELEWKGKSKQAKTFIHLIKKDENGHCFLIRPYTGRTHQIRKHFARYLVPVEGDPIYGEYSRHHTMRLICFAYIFPHPITGKKMKIKYIPENLFDTKSSS